jgi:hypothetical protein
MNFKLLIFTIFYLMHVLATLYCYKQTVYCTLIKNILAYKVRERANMHLQGIACTRLLDQGILKGDLCK